MVPTMAHPFATNSPAAWNAATATDQHARAQERHAPTSSRSNRHLDGLLHAQQQRPQQQQPTSSSSSSFSSARRLEPQRPPIATATADISRAASSRSLATTSTRQPLHYPIQSPALNVPLDPDAIVQAAHPDHPDHHLWVERFGGSTSRRRTSSNNPATSASASPSVGSSSKRNSSHTSSGMTAPSSSDASSDDARSPAASPRARRRPGSAMSPERIRRREGQFLGQGIQVAAPAAEKRRKKKDKGKAKAPPPPRPPPRVSSSAATSSPADGFAPPSTTSSHPDAPIHFPSHPGVQVPPLSFGGAIEQAQEVVTDPVENIRSYNSQEDHGRSGSVVGGRFLPPLRSAAAGTHNHTPSVMTNGSSASSQYPESISHSRKLSGASSSANGGSSSYDTAVQHISRPSSAIGSFHKTSSPSGTPVRAAFNSATQQAGPSVEPDTPHSEPQLADSRGQDPRSAQGDSYETASPPTPRGRAASLDLLRETLSFGPSKNGKRPDPSDDVASAAQPSRRKTGTGTRIRASFDAVRPKFLAPPVDSAAPSIRKDTTADDDADDMMEWSTDTLKRRKRNRLASLFSAFRPGDKSQPTALPPASSDLYTSEQQWKPHTFAGRASRSMDIPRRPVPRFEDPSSVPAVPTLPPSLTLPALSGFGSSLQAPAQPARGRLSRVGEETEEGSDYCDAVQGGVDGLRDDSDEQQPNEAQRNAKRRAKLEQMLGETFPHTTGGAMRSEQPTGADPMNAQHTQSAENAMDEKQQLPRPIYIPEQQESSVRAQAPQDGESAAQPFPARPGHRAGFNDGVHHPSSISSLRSHDTSYSRSTSGPVTVGDSNSNNAASFVEADQDSTSFETKGLPGKFSSLWNRSKRTKNGKSKGAQVFPPPRLYSMDSTLEAPHHVSPHAGQVTHPGHDSPLASVTMAGLGIVPVAEQVPAHTERTITSPEPIETQRPRARSGTGSWRNRVSSISSMRSARRAKQDVEADLPPLPPLPASKSEPAGGIHGIGTDEDWRRNLLAEAVNLSLTGSPEMKARNELLPVSVTQGSVSADAQLQAKSAKRSPFLEVVAAGRKSFSRDRSRPTKEELDGLQVPGLPTIHKTLSPALLSEVQGGSMSGHGRSGSLTVSEDQEAEPWDGLEDEAETSRSTSRVQVHGSSDVSETQRRAEVVKQNTPTAHSRNASQQSAGSGGSTSSSRFRVHRVPVRAAAGAVSAPSITHTDFDGDVDEAKDRIAELQGNSNLLESPIASPISASASPTSPSAAASGSFSGKRATLGKHTTPPNLQLSPPHGQELLATPPRPVDRWNEDRQAGASSPTYWQGRGAGTTPPMSPSPSLGSVRGLNGSGLFRPGSKSPRVMPSPNGQFSTGAGRTSFSMDRDRAPVASPYVTHASSSPSPRIGNLRGAFRKFTSSAVSPSLRTFSPSSKGISSDQQLPNFAGRNGDDYASWDSSLAAAQAATKMLQAHTETLLPSPGWTPLTATHSQPETESLSGSVRSGGNGGSSGRFAPFHTGNDSSGGSGLEDREVLSGRAYSAAANKSSASLGAGVGNGSVTVSGSLPRPATSMTYREHTRSTTAPATTAGNRSKSCSSSVKDPPSISSSQNSYPSDLQAFDAMLRAQKSKEDAMLKNISERTRTAVKSPAM